MMAGLVLNATEFADNMRMYVPFAHVSGVLLYRARITVALICGRSLLAATKGGIRPVHPIFKTGLPTRRYSQHTELEQF